MSPSAASAPTAASTSHSSMRRASNERGDHPCHDRRRGLRGRERLEHRDAARRRGAFGRAGGGRSCGEVGSDDEHRFPLEAAEHERNAACFEHGVEEVGRPLGLHQHEQRGGARRDQQPEPLDPVEIEADLPGPELPEQPLGDDSRLRVAVDEKLPQGRCSRGPPRRAEMPVSRWARNVPCESFETKSTSRMRRMPRRGAARDVVRARAAANPACRTRRRGRLPSRRCSCGPVTEKTHPSSLRSSAAPR